MKLHQNAWEEGGGRGMRGMQGKIVSYNGWACAVGQVTAYDNRLNYQSICLLLAFGHVTLLLVALQLIANFSHC